MSKRNQPTPRYGLRPPEVIAAYGSRAVFEEVVQAKWLVPVISRHKLTIFDSGDVARVWARIMAGEFPGMEKGGDGRGKK